MVYIKRSIENDIKSSLETNKLTLVYGASGIGKTALLNSLSKEIGDIFSVISLANPENLTLIKSAFENIFTILDSNNKKFIAIDSIHYLDNQSEFIAFLKNAKTPDIHFVLTSSYISQALDDLATYYLKPLSFTELLVYKKIPALNNLSSAILNLNNGDKGIYSSDVRKVLDEYMLYGGYPAVWALKSSESKEKWLQEDGIRFIRSDVYRYGVRNMGKFFELIRLLSERVGLFFTISELASMLDISSPTVESYIRVLQNAMLVSSVKPFAGKYSKEITRTSHFYFVDLGIRNSVLNDFGSIEKRWDRDIYFKNFVYLMLAAEEGSCEINFWRTQTKVDIDFVIPAKSFALNTSFNGGEVNVNRYKVFNKYYPDKQLKFLSYKQNIKGAVSLLK